MRPKARLKASLILIVGSALYAVLISMNPIVASAVMLGYVAVLLTVFVLAEVWRKP